MPANNRKNPFLMAPALTFVVLVLLLIFSFFKGDGSVLMSLGTMILTILAFGIPFAAYVILRGMPILQAFSFHKMTKNDVSLSLMCLLSLVFCSGMLKFGIFGIGYDYSALTLYGFSFEHPETLGEGILLLLALAIIPAFCEEILFRGAVLYEYRLAGIFVSSVITAVLSSVLCFSFTDFPMTFLAALFFALARFLTDNLLSAVFVHIGYGIYTLFFEKYIWLMSSSSESRILFVFLIGTLFGVSFVYFLHMAEKRLLQRAESKESAPICAPKGKMPIILLDILTAPALWMLICLFLILAVVRLFI